MVQHSVTLVFEGELETHNWEQFRDRILDAAGAGITAVVLDLGEVTFFDSSAIRALLGARQELEPRGVKIHLGPCSRIVTYVVETTGIGQAFPPLPPVPGTDSTPSLTASGPDRVLHIANRHGGQVIEITVDDDIRAEEWPALQARLETLVRVRQPREMHLDVDGVGGMDRFAEGRAVVADALASVGGSLVVGLHQPAP